LRLIWMSLEELLMLAHALVDISSSWQWTSFHATFCITLSTVCWVKVNTDTADRIYKHICYKIISFSVILKRKDTLFQYCTSPSYDTNTKNADSWWVTSINVWHFMTAVQLISQQWSGNETVRLWHDLLHTDLSDYSDKCCNYWISLFVSYQIDSWPYTGEMSLHLRSRKPKLTTVGESLCWPRDTLYPLKLVLTLPTSGGRSIGRYSSLADSSHGV
jgi:hypothetical protein